MPRLSIVIPCLTGFEPLETTLASVLQNRPEDCEILVPHDGAYGDPYELQGEVRFVETAADAPPAEIVAAGCNAARGVVLHLLEPGTEIHEGWAEPALAHFDDPCVAAVSPLVLEAVDRTRVISAGIAYGPGGGRWVRRQGASTSGTSGQTVLGPTLAAAFYRRATLKSVGGIDPGVGLEMADVEVALSLRARGYRAVLEPESRVYHAGSCDAGQTAFQQGWCAERVFWRHASEVGWLASLMLHPVLVAGEFALGLKRGGALTRLLGRAAACLDGGDNSPTDEPTSTPEPTAAARNGQASIRIDGAHGKRPVQPRSPAERRERAA